MLHLADNFFKFRDIFSQYPIAVHAAHFMGNTKGLAQNFHKQTAAAQVFTKTVINQVTMCPDQTDGTGPDALKLGILTEQ